MPKPNDPIVQACPSGAKLVSSGSPPASIRGSSSAVPSFSDSSSNQAGTTVPFVRRIRLRLLPDQPISDQLAFSWDDQLSQLFIDADRRWDVSFQFFHGRIGDWQFPAYTQSICHCTQGSFSM
jgi:hypothetical protein